MIVRRFSRLWGGPTGVAVNRHQNLTRPLMGRRQKMHKFRLYTRDALGKRTVT